MDFVEEQERKYLISDVCKIGNWDKEHIVYQWYLAVGDGEHTKVKIIFDILRAQIIYVKVLKKMMGNGKINKKVEYLNLLDFSSKDMIGIPFVLKRRSIKGKLFLDKMIRSNDICKYLLEDEANEVSGYQDGELRIQSDVTNDVNYYNQNMCTTFTINDAKYLNFLLTIF